MQALTSLDDATRRLLGKQDYSCFSRGSTRGEGMWLPISVPVLAFLASAAMLEACDNFVPPLTMSLLVLELPA